MGPGPSLSQPSPSLWPAQVCHLYLELGQFELVWGHFTKQFTVNSPLYAQCPEQRSLGEEGLEARATVSPPREGGDVGKKASFLGAAGGGNGAEH